MMRPRCQRPSHEPTTRPLCELPQLFRDDFERTPVRHAVGTKIAVQSENRTITQRFREGFEHGPTSSASGLVVVAKRKGSAHDSEAKPQRDHWAIQGSNL